MRFLLTRLYDQKNFPRNKLVNAKFNTLTDFKKDLQ